MKEFNITGDTNSFDIVHLPGAKGAYTVTKNVTGTLTYESSDKNRKYIITDVESLSFRSTNADDTINFKLEDELLNYNKKFSCKDILDKGNSIGDGVYTINPTGADIQVYCDMSTNGGGWTLLSSYGNEGGGYFDATNWGMLNDTNPSITSIYSILDKINLFKRDNKFEFMIESKLIGNGAWYNWVASQTVSPLDWTQDLGGAPGLIKISTNSGGWGNFYGWGLSVNDDSFIDGGCTTAVSNWYWNAASIQWGSGIPTACGATVDGYDLGGQGNGESNHNKFWVR